jgi:AcrR family transcriptional regulator
VSTREVARVAIRAELAQVAVDLFHRRGFDNVTVSEVAAAAGVSRVTFLRYCGSKEESVLAGWDVAGAQALTALRARPPGEDDWTVLRHAFEPTAKSCEGDPEGVLAMVKLIKSTPLLRARNLEKWASCRPELVEALAERGDRAVTLELSMRVAAAVECVNVALEYWEASQGRLPFSNLLNDAFASLAPPQNKAKRTRAR